MPLFGPPNVAKMSSKGDIHGLIEALKYRRSTSDRDKAEYVAIRESAARALRILGSPSSAGPLIEALKEDAKSVSGAASEALVRIGAWAVEPLIAELGDGNRESRSAVAATLIRLGDSAVQPLIAALRSGEIAFRIGASEILGQIRDPRAAEPLVACLDDSALRYSAAMALAHMGDARAVEPLAAILKDSSDSWPCTNVKLALAEMDDLGAWRVVADWARKRYSGKLESHKAKWAPHWEALEKKITGLGVAPIAAARGILSNLTGIKEHKLRLYFLEGLRTGVTRALLAEDVVYYAVEQTYANADFATLVSNAKVALESIPYLYSSYDWRQDYETYGTDEFFVFNVGEQGYLCYTMEGYG